MVRCDLDQMKRNAEILILLALLILLAVAAGQVNAAPDQSCTVSLRIVGPFGAEIGAVPFVYDGEPYQTPASGPAVIRMDHNPAWTHYLTVLLPDGTQSHTGLRCPRPRSAIELDLQSSASGNQANQENQANQG